MRQQEDAYNLTGLALQLLQNQVSQARESAIALWSALTPQSSQEQPASISRAESAPLHQEAEKRPLF